MRYLQLLLVLSAVLCPPLVSHAATDVPAGGAFLRMFADADDPAQRGMSLVMLDEAIAVPDEQPGAGARLVVSGGAGEGQCRADITLAAGSWESIAGRDADGWMYTASPAAPGGVQRIVLFPGVLWVIARGEAWPCDLAAPQRLPFALRLVLDDKRYCAAFGGFVRANGAGIFAAHWAPAPLQCVEKGDVTVANLNILHGLGCGDDFCRFADRVDLFYDWVVEAGCPDVVTLQEILVNTIDEFDGRLADACPFPYESAHMLDNVVDDVLFLSRYPIVHTEVAELHNGFRNIAHARIDHPAGLVDVFSTHLASSADGASNPCGGACPAECLVAGATTVRECQAVQAALFVESRRAPGALAFLTGDFNAEPDEWEYLHITGRGYIDTHLAAGNPECDGQGGPGCLGGRSSNLPDLQSPALQGEERIDYIFLVPPEVAGCELDTPSDDDGDGTATGPWAHLPNPFATECGPAPLPMCWTSDHDGNQADLNCE